MFGLCVFFFFQAEDGIRDVAVTGVQTCALPIFRCGSTNFALPLAVVEEIRRLRADEIEDVGGKLLTKVRDVVTEVIRLDTYLGLPPLEPVNGFFRMVVANTGNHQIGLVVEEVLGKDEIEIGRASCRERV